ncbi:MAG: cyclic nucleotide-binding domain-containing protein [Candidatus Latescibacterota bacterium]
MALQSSLLSTLQKLDLFQDLSPSQLKVVFGLCQQEVYEEGQLLCKAGADSEKIFILLSGSVRVLTPRGALLVTEEAVTTVGEAGVLTGEKRAATVVADTVVTALSIARRPLTRLMQQDAGLAIRLYRNVLLMVRQKLIAADQRIEQMFT